MDDLKHSMVALPIVHQAPHQLSHKGYHNPFDQFYCSHGPQIYSLSSTLTPIHQPINPLTTLQTCILTLLPIHQYILTLVGQSQQGKMRRSEQEGNRFMFIGTEGKDID
jgi:hypothetical protein